MKRKCIHLISSKDGKRSIYIDHLNKDEILAYIQKDDRHKKKFRFIAEIILDGHRNTEIYDKEEINKKCKNVTAMKFFKGQDNDRIYCKEVTSGDGRIIIVAAILLEKKKSTRLNSKQIHLIETVGGYDYEV